MTRYKKFWKNNHILINSSLTRIRQQLPFSTENYSFWLRIDLDESDRIIFNSSLKKYFISIKRRNEAPASENAIDFFNRIIIHNILNVNEKINQELQDDKFKKNKSILFSLISIFNFTNETSSENPPDISKFIEFLKGDDSVILPDYANLIINTLCLLIPGANIEEIINKEIVDKMQEFEDSASASSRGNLLTPSISETLLSAPISSIPPSPTRATANATFDFTRVITVLNPFLPYTSAENRLLNPVQKNALNALLSYTENTSAHPTDTLIRKRTESLLIYYQSIKSKPPTHFFLKKYDDIRLSYKINAYKNEFSPNLNYKQQFALYSFIALGAIVGAIAGLVIGIAIGATIGGGVGSALPALGTAFGGLIGGGIGGMFAAIKGLGFGVAVGAAVGFSVLGVAGMGVGVGAYRLKKKNYLSKKPTDLDSKTSNAIKDFANSLAPTPQTQAYQPINA